MDDKLKRKNEAFEFDEGGAPGERTGRLVGAAILIGLGVLFLLIQFAPGLNLERLIVLGMGAVFLVAAFVGRNPGLAIPGCILSGLGVGVWLVSSAGNYGVDDGAIILLSLALGFVAIMPVTRLLGHGAHWWPLIPGGILGLIGLLIGFGDAGLNLLAGFGSLWPVILIAIGVYLLVRRR